VAKKSFTLVCAVLAAAVAAALTGCEGPVIPGGGGGGSLQFEGGAGVFNNPTGAAGKNR
jgi:hypothetical protein